MNNEFPPAQAMGLVNLASTRMGTKIHSVSDDFFAEAPRMLADTVPVFVPDKFDDHGKWMDGWESRRRRHGGHDWCILHLGETGIIRLVDINTAHLPEIIHPVRCWKPLIVQMVISIKQTGKQ